MMHTQPAESSCLLAILPFFAAAVACSQTLVITASKVDGKEQYMFVTVTFLSESLKFTFCVIGWVISRAFSKQDSASFLNEENDASSSLAESLLYAVPAALYTIDNNVIYIILLYLDPATYSLVWNCKIVSITYYLGHQNNV
jgi:hypothetical protein